MNNNFLGVVIDPGHGGVDSGAIYNNLLEKDYNLLISRYMYDRFIELGVPVYLTRDSDVTLNPNDRTKAVLSFLGNNPNVVVISNHLNAGGGDGAEVIYALRNDSRLANSILGNIDDIGQNTRRVYQRRLPSNSNKDYYYMLRDAGNTEALIVEYGFIDNSSDVEFLKDNYKELAEAVVKSVLEYKNIPYKEPSNVITDIYKVSAGDTVTLKKLVNGAIEKYTIKQTYYTSKPIGISKTKYNFGTPLYKDELISNSDLENGVILSDSEFAKSLLGLKGHDRVFLIDDELNNCEYEIIKIK